MLQQSFVCWMWCVVMQQWTSLVLQLTTTLHCPMVRKHSSPNMTSYSLINYVTHHVISCYATWRLHHTVPRLTGATASILYDDIRPSIWYQQKVADSGFLLWLNALNHILIRNLFSMFTYHRTSIIGPTQCLSTELDSWNIQWRCNKILVPLHCSCFVSILQFVTPVISNFPKLNKGSELNYATSFLLWSGAWDFSNSLTVTFL